MEARDPSHDTQTHRVGLATLGLVLAVVAVVVLVGWLQSRSRRQLLHNESAAIAVLKNISAAQSQMQASGSLDFDGDGVGGFGFFHELATGASFADGQVVPGTHPHVLAAAFADRAEVRANGGGAVVRSGYLFQIWLPSGGEGWVAEPARGSREIPRVDVERSERAWLCVAWPLERGRTGRRAFVVDHLGDVRAARNVDSAYSGFDRVPDPVQSRVEGAEPVRVGNAVYPPQVWAPNAQAPDGEHWVVI